MPKRSAKKIYAINTSPGKKPWRLILTFAVIILISVFAILEITNTTHLLHSKTVPKTIPLTTKDSGSNKQVVTKTQSSSNNSAAQSNTEISKNPSVTGSSSSTNLTLIEPYGQFVSNHRPGQNSPTDEVSICDTTPGANCYIKFTAADNSTSTQLPVQTAGSDGSTSWAWNSNILTNGKWQVTAIASLNGQTKSATDPTLLEIQ
ncbi:MAG TPA: hypothetical protein VLF79_01510 [Candidatus Saccharimonadales bacterium]|nr:hypothetical protein [Candidatus Saccharimonadales bacterium]